MLRSLAAASFAAAAHGYRSGLDPADSWLCVNRSRE
jgi:hypothetical protein